MKICRGKVELSLVTHIEVDRSPGQVCLVTLDPLPCEVVPLRTHDCAGGASVQHPSPVLHRHGGQEPQPTHRWLSEGDSWVELRLADTSSSTQTQNAESRFNQSNHLGRIQTGARYPKSGLPHTAAHWRWCRWRWCSLRIHT